MSSLTLPLPVGMRRCGRWEPDGDDAFGDVTEVHHVGGGTRPGLTRESLPIPVVRVGGEHLNTKHKQSLSENIRRHFVDDKKLIFVNILMKKSRTKYLFIQFVKFINPFYRIARKTKQSKFIQD